MKTMKTMKTTMKINQMTRKVVLTIAALLFVMTMNSAQNMYLSHEAVLSGLLKQAYHNNLPMNRNYVASPVFYAVLEPEVMIERWMTNSGDWKDARNSIKLNYLLTEETEEPLQIESWMLENFSKETTTSIDTQNVPEETTMVETWMLNPSSWGN